MFFKKFLPKLIVALAIGLIILAGLILFVSKSQAPTVNQDANVSTLYEKQETKVIYVIDKGNQQKEFASRVDENATVFSVLEKLAQEQNFQLKYNNNYEFGVFIESIDGVANGTDGKYWQYYVNDKLGEVAADKKEVKAGDKVEWRFEKVPEF